ncbi:MAG: Hpt domain-containing protein [Deltaproteobacteria bacterium]|nr:Hpt domain-containing protein [bacterium]MCB9488610.1 Hpt domain-containing protein [Deltaproteobacteria bacterium]
MSDLYSPEEMAEQKLDLLTRLLNGAEDEQNPRERARMIGHKLHGTAAYFGLDDLAAAGLTMERNARDESVAEADLDSELSEILAAMSMLRDELREEFPSIYQKVALALGAA